MLQERIRTAAGTTQAAIPSRPQGDSAPLSFAQQRLWFLDQLQPGNTAYNVSRHVRITGDCDRRALESAFTALIERHESLRTVFRMKGDEPVQIIQSIRPFSLPVIDLSHLEEKEREKEIKRRAAAHAHTRFNLAEGPLLAAELIRVSAQEHVLFLVLHHIITDAWSTALLISELASLYQAIQANDSARLSELPIQYADFAVWQRDLLSGENLEKQLSFWKQQLAGAPAILELPADRPRAPVQTFQGAFESFSIQSRVT